MIGKPMPRHTTAAVLCLLLLALLPWPYGYYIFLRIAVCLWGIAAGIHLRAHKPGGAWPLLAWGIAILYNPIVKIPLEREVWEIVNLLTAGAVLLLWKTWKQPCA